MDICFSLPRSIPAIPEKWTQKIAGTRSSKFVFYDACGAIWAVYYYLDVYGVTQHYFALCRYFNQKWGSKQSCSMELFSRRRWRLVSAQVVSCGVYENTNNRNSASRAITKVVWQLGRYEPSPPSIKELHGCSNDKCRWGVHYHPRQWSHAYATVLLISVTFKLFIYFRGSLFHSLKPELKPLYKGTWSNIFTAIHISERLMWPVANLINNLRL